MYNYLDHLTPLSCLNLLNFTNMVLIKVSDTQQRGIESCVV